MIIKLFFKDYQTWPKLWKSFHDTGMEYFWKQQSLCLRLSGCWSWAGMSFSFLNMGGHKLPTVCGCLFGQPADTHMAMQTLTYRQPGIQRGLRIDRRLT